VAEALPTPTAAQSIEVVFNCTAGDEAIMRGMRLRLPHLTADGPYMGTALDMLQQCSPLYTHITRRDPNAAAAQLRAALDGVVRGAVHAYDPREDARVAGMASLGSTDSEGGGGEGDVVDTGASCVVPGWETLLFGRAQQCAMRRVGDRGVGAAVSCAVCALCRVLNDGRPLLPVPVTTRPINAPPPPPNTTQTPPRATHYAPSSAPPRRPFWAAAQCWRWSGRTPPCGAQRCGAPDATPWTSG